MSIFTDVENLGGDVSKEWHELLGEFRGKAEPTLAADGKAILDLLQKIGAGISGAEKDVPGLVVLVETLVTQVAAAASAKGLNFGADAAAAQTLLALARQLEQALKDYSAGAALVVATPAKA